MCDSCVTKDRFDIETEEVSMPRKGLGLVRAATESPISEALNSYDFRLEELSELINTLEDKLDPVILSTDGTMERNHDDVIADRHGKLSFSIMEKNDRLAKLSGKIRRIISNLEL